MSSSLLFLGLWMAAAGLAAVLPRPRDHWLAAAALIVVGVPLLGLVTLQHGPLAGFLALGAGASILRWPLRRGFDRLRPRHARQPHETPAE